MGMSDRTARFIVLLALSSTTLVRGGSQTPQESTPSKATSPASNDSSLRKALGRVQLDLKQLAMDIKTLGTRMLQQTRNSDTQDSTAAKVHGLLKNSDPATLIQEFVEAPQDRGRWEACLKSGRLYRNLAAAIFAKPTRRTPDGSRTEGQPIARNELDQLAQLFFLSRMIPELELQYAGLQTEPTTATDADQKSWQSLWEALRQDDQAFLGEAKLLLSSTGELSNQFVVRILSDAEKTSPAAASTILRSMAILDPVGNVWKLATIPGIAPDFLAALECERSAMEGAVAADFRGAVIRAVNCRGSADGRTSQAFAAPPVLPAQPTQNGSKTPTPASAEAPLGRDIFHLPTEKELQDLQGQGSSGDTTPKAIGQPPTFGVSNTAVKRPKIPSWWIRCACPSDHPDAGIVFEGVRWHAPVLQCPNPELRRLEVK